MALNWKKKLKKRVLHGYKWNKCCALSTYMTYTRICIDLMNANECEWRKICAKLFRERLECSQLKKHKDDIVVLQFYILHIYSLLIPQQK